MLRELCITTSEKKPFWCDIRRGCAWLIMINCVCFQRINKSLEATDLAPVRGKGSARYSPGSKFHGAYIGPNWGRQAHLGLMLAPWNLLSGSVIAKERHLSKKHLGLCHMICKPGVSTRSELKCDSTDSLAGCTMAFGWQQAVMSLMLRFFRSTCRLTCSDRWVNYQNRS